MTMLAALALSVARLSREPPRITCVVAGPHITVRFLYEASPGLVMDKFAVVQSASLRGGEWFFVVDPDDEHPIRFSPYRPGMKRLTIDTRQLRAVTFKAGKARIVPAFPRPGRYALVFADILETELENMAYWTCTVRVRPGFEGRAVPARVEAAPARR